MTRKPVTANFQPNMAVRAALEGSVGTVLSGEQ
jgi:hypothetical protein